MSTRELLFHEDIIKNNVHKEVLKCQCIWLNTYFFTSSSRVCNMWSEDHRSPALLAEMQIPGPLPGPAEPESQGAVVDSGFPKAHYGSLHLLCSENHCSEGVRSFSSPPLTLDRSQLLRKDNTFMWWLNCKTKNTLWLCKKYGCVSLPGKTWAGGKPHLHPWFSFSVQSMRFSSVLLKGMAERL